MILFFSCCESSYLFYFFCESVLVFALFVSLEVVSLVVPFFNPYLGTRQRAQIHQSTEWI